MSYLIRKTDTFLRNWKKNPDRYPLIIKGARQVGKTETIRKFAKENYKNLVEIIYVFLTIFLYLLKCPQSLILSALRAFCFCGKPHISRSIFLYFRYQAWLKSW
ncbi:MAG: hypothetical protein ACLRWB_10700 [Gallintestinimicrobium sp.]|uniref:hypothetical protein n=1 Tax=Gallintestinimicrobium sp. TaxID=2981655 RepID=UPI00399F0D41